MVIVQGVAVLDDQRTLGGFKPLDSSICCSEVMELIIFFIRQKGSYPLKRELSLKKGVIPQKGSYPLKRELSGKKGVIRQKGSYQAKRELSGEKGEKR